MAIHLQIRIEISNRKFLDHAYGIFVDKEKTRIMRAATILSVYVTFIVMCYIYATISGILMQILICINYVIISVVIPTLFIYANQNIKIFVMKYFKSLFCCFPNLNNINVAHQMNNNNNDIDMHIQHI